MTGSFVKSFGECCWSTVLTAAWHCMAVKSLYSFSEICVRVGGVKSLPFTLGVALREECLLSPLILIVYNELNRQSQPAA